VARGEPLMLFDQISKHCWWRGMHPQHPQRWNRPCPGYNTFGGTIRPLPSRYGQSVSRRQWSDPGAAGCVSLL